MDQMEVRAKAAEISGNITGRIVEAIIIKHGNGMLKEIAPVAFAPMIEKYILTGEGALDYENIFRVRR